MHKKNILVLMKRFGSNKDMVKENFGREIRLFEQLSGKYNIDFVCPDYHLKERFKIKKNGVNYFVVPVSFFNPFPMMRSIGRLMVRNRYEMIIPTADPLMGIIGYFFSKKYRIPIIYEVQDNYEMYDSYKIPFMRFLDHRIIRKSDYIFYSNYTLMKKLRHLRKDRFEVIENGVDLKLFKKMPKNIARKKLKLDQSIKIIAYTGHISKRMGIDNLIEAVGMLREHDKSIYILLSGKIDDDVNIRFPFVIYRKFPKREQLVLGLNASDVLVIASDDDPFTLYCFPQKLPEYMAMNIPIVATAVGDVKRMLYPFKDSLCKPRDVNDLKDKISIQLKKKRVNYRKVIMGYTWKKLSKKIDNMLEAVLEKK